MQHEGAADTADRILALSNPPDSGDGSITRIEDWRNHGWGMPRDHAEIAFIYWLLHRYGELASTGITTRDIRKQRARDLILEKGEARLADRRGVTLAAVFRWVYEESLTPEPVDDEPFWG